MMKKRKIILSIIMVMLVICTLLSVSYAFYTINAGDQIVELGTETIIPSCADAPLSGGTIVALKNDNSSPVSDAKALNSGDAYRYSFSITNGCTTNYKIKIALAPSVNSTMPYRAIKYALIEQNASIPTTGKYLTDLTEEELSSDIVREVYEQTSIDVETGFAILDATLSANETKDYYLYVWVDYYEGDRTSTGVYNNSTTDTMFTANLVVTGYEDLGLNLLAYAVYSETDNSLTFYKNFDEVVAGNEYNGKIATKVYTGIETDTYTYDSNTATPNTPWYEYANVIKTVSVANEIAPKSTAMWFTKLINLESIDLTNLDTSQVTSMERMFDKAGQNNSNFTLNLGDKFDTSNVINMKAMFQKAGENSLIFTLDLGDGFDTSKVTDMSGLFNSVGYSNTNFSLDLGSEFDTSNVTNMMSMFQYVGYSNPNFTFSLGEKFDTSKVTNMRSMFQGIANSSLIFTLNLGDKFDTSNVTNMYQMFRVVGYHSTVFTLDLGDKFDTSKVTDMSYMFYSIGANNTSFALDLGKKFDTSQVENMEYMFIYTGEGNPNFTLDLSNFNVSSSCNLAYFARRSASKIIFGEGWANATLVAGMFSCDSSKPIEIINAPANILAYNFAADNRVVTFTTI